MKKRGEHTGVFSSSTTDSGGVNDVNCSEQFLMERHWILTVLDEGMRDRLDYNVCQQQYIFKMIMSFYPSTLASKKSRGLVVSILTKVASLPDTAQV